MAMVEHLAAMDDGLAIVRPVLDRVADFSILIAQPADTDFAALRAAEQLPAFMRLF